MTASCILHDSTCDASSISLMPKKKQGPMSERHTHTPSPASPAVTPLLKNGRDAFIISKETLLRVPSLEASNMSECKLLSTNFSFLHHPCHCRHCPLHCPLPYRQTRSQTSSSTCSSNTNSKQLSGLFSCNNTTKHMWWSLHEQPLHRHHRCLLLLQQK